MRNYLDLAYRVLTRGTKRKDRTGTGTLSIFDQKLMYDLQKGFPAVTTKKLFIKGVWVELLWMLSGKDNIKDMQNQGVHIWDEWAAEDGHVGPIYGVQWRNWKKYTLVRTPGGEELLAVRTTMIDQLNDTINQIRTNPTSRRLLVSAWNVAELSEMALPPCHYAFQFYVRDGEFLDCKVQMRSVDVFLGLPFDIASYATLTHIIAYLSNLEPGILTMDLGDTHIYLNHVEQMKEQIFRQPYPLPKLYMNVIDRYRLEDFILSDFALIDYRHHPAIKGEISK